MESWIYIGRSQWFYRIKKLLVPVSSKMIIIMVKFCPFYPLIVVKTRSGKLNDWANSLARQVFPLQIENSKLLYYIYYMYQKTKGGRYVLRTSVPVAQLTRKAYY